MVACHSLRPCCNFLCSVDDSVRKNTTITAHGRLALRTCIHDNNGACTDTDEPAYKTKGAGYDGGDIPGLYLSICRIYYCAGAAMERDGGHNRLLDCKRERLCAIQWT